MKFSSLPVLDIDPFVKHPSLRSVPVLGPNLLIVDQCALTLAKLGVLEGRNCYQIIFGEKGAHRFPGGVGPTAGIFPLRTRGTPWNEAVGLIALPDLPQQFDPGRQRLVNGHSVVPEAPGGFALGAGRPCNGHFFEQRVSLSIPQS